MGAQWKQKGREAAANAKGRVMTKLSVDPLIHPTARVSDSRLGRYTEIESGKLGIVLHPSDFKSVRLRSPIELHELFPSRNDLGFIR